MVKEVVFGTECKHWNNCDFRNDITCDSELCEEFELNEKTKTLNTKFQQIKQEEKKNENI